MEINKMKKSLAIIILSVFVFSIMGSVLPGVKTTVMNLTGGQKYASTQLPAPPEFQMNQKLAKN
jgi:hypothetical protein